MVTGTSGAESTSAATVGDATGSTSESGGMVGEFPALPVAANAFGAAAIGDFVYVSGGHVGAPHDSSVQSLLAAQWRLQISDPSAGWQAMENLAGPTQQTSLTEFAGQLYRVGGLTSRHQPGEASDLYTLADFDRYDPATNLWTELPPMPDTRGSHSAALLGSTLYVTGGWKLEGPSDSAQYHTTWLSIDLAAAQPQWQVHEQPFQVRDHCSGVFGGRVYVLGGMLTGTFPKQSWVYDPAQPVAQWQPGPEIPTNTPLQGFACSSVSVGDNLYFTAAEGVVFSLTGDGQSWAPVGQLQQPRMFHQIVTLSANRIMALGGGVGMDLVPTDSVEVVELGVAGY